MKNMLMVIVGWMIGFSTAISVSAQTTRPHQDQQPSAAQRIERATNNINNKQLFQLAYKLQNEETVRWSVEHVASTKTQMAGELEETSSRSVSVKNWKVSSVDSLGNMTFVHSIESVDMWQKIGDDEPVMYNSKTSKTIPTEYSGVADKLNKPLATISITPDGQIKDKKTSLTSTKFGVGEVTIPLPPNPIPVGQKWKVPVSLSATDEDARQIELKARIAYELVKVKDGNAYISFKTEVLTPIESDKVKSQIMQQKTKGYLVFDIQQGRPIRKEVEWDEKVQGYDGPDSYLQYLGRMSEKLLAASESAPVVQNATPLMPLKSEVADRDADRDADQSVKRK